MADRVQHARDTLANWQSENPILLEGELGLVTDQRGLWKWGDGVTPWNNLPWCGFNGTVAQETGTSTMSVMSQKAVTDALNALKTFSYEVVDNLPTASADTMGKIYLTASSQMELGDVMDEWITIEYESTYMWEHIGSTKPDLSGYVRKETGKGLSTNDFDDYYKGTIASLLTTTASLSTNKLEISFVSELPTITSQTLNKLFLVPSDTDENAVDAYVVDRTGNTPVWKQIGSAAIDIDNYATKAEMNAAIEGGFYY